MPATDFITRQEYNTGQGRIHDKMDDNQTKTYNKIDELVKNFHEFRGEMKGIVSNIQLNSAMVQRIVLGGACTLGVAFVVWIAKSIIESLTGR